MPARRSQPPRAEPRTSRTTRTRAGSVPAQAAPRRGPKTSRATPGPRPDWRCPACGRGFAARNASHSCAVQAVEALLRPYPKPMPVYRAVRKAIAAAGPTEVAATKTQVSWRNRIRFAWLWVPAMALNRGPLDVVVSFALPAPLASPRIKEVVEVAPGRFMHHVVLLGAAAVDRELAGWLRAAHREAA